MAFLQTRAPLGAVKLKSDSKQGLVVINKVLLYNAVKVYALSG
jgi:hypothetical protein